MLARLIKSVRYRIENVRAFASYLRRGNALSPEADLILLFHGIDNVGSQKYNLRFTAQSDFLFLIHQLRRYYSLCPLRDLKAHADFPRLAVTFDDGYLNWKTYLAPLIEKYQIPVTLFITKSDDTILWTDQYDIFRRHYSKVLTLNGHIFHNVGGIYRTHQGHDLNTFLKQSPLEVINEFRQQASIGRDVLDRTRMYWELLNDDDIRNLSTSEWIDIGSHGCSHTSLDQLRDDQLQAELVASKQTLSRICGSDISTLSFPSGRFDKRVIKSAGDAGYNLFLAETLEPPIDGVENISLLGRKGIYSIGNRYKQIENLIAWL